MIEVASPNRYQQSQTQTKINYFVAMNHPETHLFEVTLRVVDYSLSKLDLKLPVWTPGSYLVREYAKHLQDFTVVSENKSLQWRKISKNHWQIDTENVSEITVSYRVYAAELTVRTNHLDATHGYFNGAALFFRILEWEHQPISVTILPPRPEWQVSTSLPTTGLENTYLAADFDTLVDSPFEIGSHQLHKFEVSGKPHELAIWGQGNLKVPEAIADIQNIIEVETEIFGDLPYDRYLFILHLSSQAYGGLEHKNSCSLIYNRFGFRDREKYNRFMQLVAHEFFHLWNVKRIRPIELEIFDYDQENYTGSLWFCEGTTSYYDLLIPLRAGIYDRSTYLTNLSKEISRYETTPGRRIQPLSESSFDAWIKLYRPDANSPNSQISYYLKGEMVTLLLDLMIRSRHQNQRSLDDVMRKMWEQFGTTEIGYTSQQLQQVLELVAGTDLNDFFHRYVNGIEDLPFNDYLEPFGLELIAEPAQDAYLGIKVNSSEGKELIRFVEAGSPAQIAGIDAGDELLAIDGIKVTANQLSDRLGDYHPQDTIEITVFHQDQLRTYSVILTNPRANKYQVKLMETLNSTQQENLAGWLGDEVK